MKTVLLIDDDLATLEIINECIRPYFRTRIATRGEKALELAHLRPLPDLVMLDVELPDMDGYAICAALKQDSVTADIPVIFLSSHTEIGGIARGLELGAVDYVSKPVAPPILLARMHTHVRLREVQKHLAERNLELENLIRERTQSLETTMLELQRNRELTIVALGTLAEFRDPGTRRHVLRTRKYVQALIPRLWEIPGQRARLTPEQWTLTWKCVPLHDIGNIGVADTILLKRGPLDAEEFALMKSHTTLGRDALAAAELCVTADDPFLRVATDIVYAHHERWDGRGYPQGLCGENIPLPARLMAIADVYDALISNRAHKTAMAHEEAVEAIRQDSGKHFDPLVVESFLRCADEFRAIALRHPDIPDGMWGR